MLLNTKKNFSLISFPVSELIIIISFSQDLLSDPSKVISNLKLEKGFSIEIFAENIKSKQKINLIILLMY